MGQINLSALKTRSDFAKRLKSLYPDANWDEVMETVCVLGLRHLRQGEPVLGSVSRPTFLRLRYDLPPSYTTDFRPYSSDLAESGNRILPYSARCSWNSVDGKRGLCGVPGPTLYIDYESDYSDLMSRAKRIRQGHPKLTGIEPLYRRSHIPLADDLSTLQRLVAESGIKFLVIDSLAAACGAELERAETAIRFFNALRSLRLSSLILAHVAKNAEEKSIYGSLFFSNFARSTWEMKKAQEAGEQITRVGLYHRKNNLGLLEKPLGFKLRFGEAFQLESTNLLEEPSLIEGLPVKDRLQASLRAGAMTAKELAEETGIALASVKARLSEGQGLWSTKTGGEKWGLLRRG